MKNINLLIKSFKLCNGNPKLIKDLLYFFNIEHLKADYPNIFSNYQTNPKLIKHDIYTDSQISIKLLEWHNNIESGFHNHNDYEYCIYKVLDGKLIEKQNSIKYELCKNTIKINKYPFSHNIINNNNKSYTIHYYGKRIIPEYKFFVICK